MKRPWQAHPFRRSSHLWCHLEITQKSIAGEFELSIAAYGDNQLQIDLVPPVAIMRWIVPVGPIPVTVSLGVQLIGSASVPVQGSAQASSTYRHDGQAGVRMVSKDVETDGLFSLLTAEPDEVDSATLIGAPVDLQFRVAPPISISIFGVSLAEEKGSCSRSAVTAATADRGRSGAARRRHRSAAPAGTRRTGTSWPCAGRRDLDRHRQRPCDEPGLEHEGHLGERADTTELKWRRLYFNLAVCLCSPLEITRPQVKSDAQDFNMDVDRLSGSPLGELVPVSVDDARNGRTYNHHAFVAAPLPDAPPTDEEALAPLMDAQIAIGRLDGASSELPDPLLVVRPTIRREAVSTSALEGTYAGLDDVFQAEVEGDEPRGQVREVLNYVHAVEHGLTLLEERPISIRMVNELHRILLAGTRGDSNETGRVRDRQNWIGPRDGTIEDSQFVPPPPGDELRRGLAAWERWIHEEEIPLLLRVALGHYQFETLHPYIDGNGRLGRLLVILQLIEGGALSHHLMTVSPYFEARRREYTDHLQGVRETGEFGAWIAFFARGLQVQAEEALRTIRSLQEHRAQTLATLRSEGVRGLAIQIAEDLIGYPYVKATGVADRYGRSYQAANNAIATLVERGVLREITGRSYDRIFAATEVFRLVSGET